MTGRRGAAALILILLLAAALRLPGLFWGVPDEAHPDFSWHPDEAAQLYWARAMAQGQVLVGQFIYGGTLHFSVLNAYYHYGNLLADVFNGYSDLANAIMFGRCMVALISLLTVLLTWRIGVRLFGDTAGLLAAAFLALSPAHVFLAQNVRPDELGTLLALLPLWLGARMLQGAPADRRHFAAAGLLLGIGVALRFPLAAFSVAPPLAWLLRERQAGWKPLLSGLLRWRMPLMLALGAVAYALASPWSLLHFHDGLLRGLEVQRSYQVAPFADAAERGPGIYQYGWIELRQALGVPLHLLALAGVALACLRPTPQRLLVLAPALGYFIPTTLASWVVVRYTLPIVPLLALLAAVAAGEAAPPDRPWRRSMVVTATTALLLWTLLSDLAFLKVQTGRNVRDLATDWIRAEVPAGASIVEVRQYPSDSFHNPVIPTGYIHNIFVAGSSAENGLLDSSRDHDYLVLSGPTFYNMDRLGPRNPQHGGPALQLVLQSGHYALERELTVPVRLLGLDFSEDFTSQDYRIINPGERIYRHIGPAVPAAGAG